ncbi:MAG: phospho-N-acetylmuramoyl-pentapeptide-transferase [Clostridia bacterium]|nr:phospho-N-acetylmuramoyl-pentapeptide-transferase [Clostridia bacterium]
MNNYITAAVLAAAFILSFALCAVITRILIPRLKSLKMGQKILDIGPRWHKGKEGTPTMGGLAMIVTLAVVTFIAFIAGLIYKDAASVSVRAALVFGYALLNGLTGIIDDRVKLLKKQNEGLKAWQKYALQFLCAVLFIVGMRLTNNMDTTLHIPFTTFRPDLGIFYYVFAVLLLTGMVNAVNLTDGIDGLASSDTLLIGVFYSVLAFSKLGGADTALLGGSLAGMCGGFLVYNFYPAKIFMGDTGSLFLGGLVVGGAFMIGSPFTVVLFGLIFIIETLSVILQVASFKLTKKRIFKMAPIHHHFEMCGWSEIKIVSIFSAITAVMCIVSYFALRGIM